MKTTATAVGTFPVSRLRRLRMTETLRSMVRETALSTGDFVYPLFVVPGAKVKREVSSMPGVFQMSVDELVRECVDVHALGEITAVPAHIGFEVGDDLLDAAGAVLDAAEQLGHVLPQVPVLHAAHQEIAVVLVVRFQDRQPVLPALPQDVGVQAPLKQHWVDKLLSQKAARVERNIELHYGLQSVLWLQIRGESMRNNPNQIPDYFRLSQTLRTVGSYIDNRGMPILSLRRGGATLYLELQEQSGKKRVEEHAIGSFENYFLRTYLRGRREKPS